MKKLLTLAAVAALAFSAQAKEELAYSCDYSVVTTWNKWVMGYIPQIVDGELIAQAPMVEYIQNSDYYYEQYYDQGFDSWEDIVINGSDYKIRPLDEPASWYQFFINDQTVFGKKGMNHKITVECYSPDLADGEEATVTLQCRWSWAEDPINVDIPVTNEKRKVVGYCNGPGDDVFDIIFQTYFQGAVHISYMEVTYEDVSIEKEYVNILTNGDASSDWENPNMTTSDRNWSTVCAWSSEAALQNYHPCDIERVDGSRVFVVHATEMIENPWDNQFYITAPRKFEQGEEIKISFRMKATHAASIGTQCHVQPGNYRHWACIGSPTFTTDWTEFSRTLIVDGSMAGFQTFAFNLNEYEGANDYYFDDIRIEVPMVEEGWFIASDAIVNGLYEAAQEMIYDREESGYVAYIGTEEEPASWFVISSQRGSDYAFKANSIYVYDDLYDDSWFDYDIQGNGKKMYLPEAGIWKIVVDPDAWQIFVYKADISHAPHDPEPNDPDPNDPDPQNPVEGYNLWVDSQNVRIGVNQIALYLDNVDDVTAFQLDIELPNGLEMVYLPDEEEYDVTDSDRLSRSHTLSSSDLDGMIRVACYSSRNAAFNENSGELIYLPIVVPDDAQPGEEFVLNIKNIEITKVDQLERIKLPDCSAALIVEDPLLIGDANNDGVVTITDVTYVVAKILGNPLPTFNERAADANGDGVITITDVTHIVAIILSQL